MLPLYERHFSETIRTNSTKFADKMSYYCKQIKIRSDFDYTSFCRCNLIKTEVQVEMGLDCHFSARPSKRRKLHFSTRTNTHAQ